MQNLASAFPKHARRSATHDLPLSHRHVSIHGREEQLRSRLEAMVPPEFLTALEALQKECGDGLIAARKLLAALDRLCKIAGGVVAVRSAARKVAEADGVVEFVDANEIHVKYNRDEMDELVSFEDAINVLQDRHK